MVDNPSNRISFIITDIMVFYKVRFLIYLQPYLSCIFYITDHLVANGIAIHIDSFFGKFWFQYD